MPPSAGVGDSTLILKGRFRETVLPGFAKGDYADCAKGSPRPRMHSLLFRLARRCFGWRAQTCKHNNRVRFGMACAARRAAEKTQRTKADCPPSPLRPERHQDPNEFLKIPRLQANKHVFPGRERELLNRILEGPCNQNCAQADPL